MSLSDYMKNQQTTSTPEPVVVSTPEPTPSEAPVQEPVAPVETPAAEAETAPAPAEENTTGAVANPAVPGSPVVTKSPTDETVKPGGSCWFTAEHNGAELARWRFISPEGEDLQFDEVKAKFPELKILQGEYSHMKLENIPAELDGWRVYCRYTNKVGSIDTKTATIHVTADGTPGVTGAPGSPVVTKSPTDETVKPGGSCWFQAKHTGAQLARWHFVSPDGQTDVQYDEAAKMFPDLKIKNGEFDAMQLSNIPADLNGWRVYCRFSNKAGAGRRHRLNPCKKCCCRSRLTGSGSFLFLRKQVGTCVKKRGGRFACRLRKMQILGLADLVDVTGEVEHLVGEAPLIVIPVHSFQP